MKFLKENLIVALVFSSAAIHAADWDHARNIRDGVVAFHQSYQAGGVQKLIEDVAMCHGMSTQLPPRSDVKLRRLEFCLSMDIASMLVDKAAAAQGGFARTPYFSDEAFSGRIVPLQEWFNNSQVSTVLDGLFQEVSNNLSTLSQPQARSSKLAGSSLPGRYAGSGNGQITLQIGTPKEGNFPITVTTSARTAGDGGCGGTVTGSGRMVNGDMLMIAESGAERCEIRLKIHPTGIAMTIQEKGCQSLHGAACSFEGDVSKRR